MKKLTLLLLMLSGFVFGKTINLDITNTINFNQSFTSSFVALKQVQAINLCSRNPGKEIYITLYTPGGSISAGQLFFDTLNALPCKFHTITIFAASMGYQTVQNLGERYILPSGTLMSHRASISGLSGELGGELDVIIKHLKDSVRDMEKTAASRIGSSLEDYKKSIRDELWLTGKEAIEGNHADKIALVSCDKSLMGTTKEVYNTFFGAYSVEFSNCPIITGPISVTPLSSNSTVEDFLTYRSTIMKKVKTSL